MTLVASALAVLSGVPGDRDPSVAMFAFLVAGIGSP